MSWSIANISNTVEIDSIVAEELFKYDKYNEYWYHVDDVAYRGHLSFNTDHQEHMDYVSNPKIQDILKKHKVKGCITFGSLEGDNRGQFWGYEFDGKGNMFELVGVVKFDRT